MPHNILKQVAAKLPGIKKLVRERDTLYAEANDLKKELSIWRKGFVPPGHYYSPIPDLEQLKRMQANYFEHTIDEIPGINLNKSKQLDLLEIFSNYYADMPFPENADVSFRYYLNNDFYAYSDGICLYSMLRYLNPKRFIEIGSGFSSAATLDTRDRFLSPELELIFIEPYPERLEALMRKDDLLNPNIKIIRSFVQDVPLDTFSLLQSGDILFIDSTHVSRVGSDVNYLFFEVIPSLNPGVYVHIHDVFFPFEYPEAWILGGRSWSELYLLRAFLEYNESFEIVYFNSFLDKMFRDDVQSKMPLCLSEAKNKLTIPGSIWLQKTR